MATKRYRAIDLPITRDLICQRGATLRSSLYKHKDPVTKLPRNLTGCTITVPGILPDGTTVDLTSYLVIDYAGGKYRVIVPPSVTNGLTPWPAGIGSHQIKITDTLGVVSIYFHGALGLKEAE